MNHEQREAHRKVIDDFLSYLNKKTNQFVLKGGTSLMKAYGLDRFSEDIDLDGQPEQDIFPIVEAFCESRGYTCNTNKNTPVVQRKMIHYCDNAKPLKVEVSYRNGCIPRESYVCIDGIQVYTLPRILSMKINAYLQRDKIRDLYDITFIGLHYADSLPRESLAQLKDALSFRGLEHFDYLVSTQEDELIDIDKLSGDFLTLWDNMGLLNYKETDICDITQEDVHDFDIAALTYTSFSQQMAQAERMSSGNLAERTDKHDDISSDYEDR